MVYPPALLIYPQIDPFVFRIGQFGLSWYAFMYLLGFTLAYFLLRYRFQKGALRLQDKSQVSLLVTFCFYGIILGARIFYVLFYNLSYYIEHPWEIPALWHGGLSFHGGLIGCIVAMYWFARREKAPFLNVTDNVALCTPVGLFFGRIGNFINGELWGRPGDVPWAMVFPRAGQVPRHPSQLYESLFEGLILAIILFTAARKPHFDGLIAGLLVFCYGLFRFFIEYYREPDAQLGLLVGNLSMGQLWCLAMMIAGVIIIVIARNLSKKSATGSSGL